MPTLSVWAVRLALLHVVVGTGLGGLLLVSKAVALPPWLWALRAAHVEMLLIGFVVQLVVGVGFWILPRAPARASGRPVARAVVLLNVGVVLVAGAAFVPFGSELAGIGRVCEAIAVVVFAGHVWPRVRSVRVNH